MSAVSVASQDSLRDHPQLRAIFKAAESRHLTDQELDEYQHQVPDCAARAACAREVRELEEEVVANVVDEIFLVYPYEQHHRGARVKALRDIRYVSAYATLAMLMNDPRWFDNKILLWLKTILQAFEFPDREGSARKALFSRSAEDATLEKLRPHQRSIHATYTKLRHHYQERLGEAAFALMAPYLQQAIDRLSGD